MQSPICLTVVMLWSHYLQLGIDEQGPARGAVQHSAVLYAERIGLEALIGPLGLQSVCGQQVQRLETRRHRDLALHLRSQPCC